MKRSARRLAVTELDESEFGPANPLAVGKRKPDPVRTLAIRGAITRDHERAALRIAQAVRLIAGGLYAHANNFDAGGRGHPSIAATESAIACEMRYLAWADAMDTKRWPIGPILDLTCDGLSLNQLERKWRRRRHSMLERIIDALDLYWSVKLHEKT